MNGCWRSRQHRAGNLARHSHGGVSSGPGGQRTLTVAGEGLVPTKCHLLQVATSSELTKKAAHQGLDTVLQGCHALLEHPADLVADLSVRPAALRAWRRMWRPTFWLLVIPSGLHANCMQIAGMVA